MKKKGMLLVVLAALLFAGCNEAKNEEERKLPTLAPEVEETESGKTDKGEGTLSGAFSSLVSYVDQSKQAMDEQKAQELKTTLTLACVDAQMEGMELPKQPLRFRYTEELEELDGTYEVLKEKIKDYLGNEGPELSIEGNYLMVEIYVNAEGNLRAEVTVEQE